MTEIQVPEAVRGIIDELDSHGFEAYAVGGCVRDSLLGRKPDDWDITTLAEPKEVKEIFKRTIDTGIQHGTVTVMIEKNGYEVTTYRVDGEYEDGRHPKSVEFTRNLREDLKRRDFTINAMAYSGRTGLVDAFGGMEDLKNQVIRCVGNARDRFAEDALRILRAVRFSAQLGFSIEKETEEAIQAIAPNLIKVSRERIAAELTKLLLSGEPEKIRLVYEYGMGPYVSEEFDRAGQRLLGLIKMKTLPEKKHMRWAGFLHMEKAEDAVKILKDLKMDNETMDQVRTLVFLWNQEISDSRPEIRKLMSRLTDQMFSDLICFQKVFCQEGYQAQLKRVEEAGMEIKAAGDCIRLRDLAVNGNDLIREGMKPGPEIGEVLTGMFKEVLINPESNHREYLMEKWKNQIKR